MPAVKDCLLVLSGPDPFQSNVLYFRYLNFKRGQWFTKDILAWHFCCILWDVKYGKKVSKFKVHKCLIKSFFFFT